MSALASDLPALIRAAIRARGPVTFAWLMEQALYHPAHGYYSSGECAIGREGDYFTSVSVGPLFGRLLAAQFAEMWEVLGRPEDFTIVEQGAHDGQLAHDLLTAAERDHAEFFAALRYRIVEPFSIRQRQQAATLADFADKVLSYPSLAELPPFRGVHFSNELLDAFSVHLVRWTGTEWRERHVTESEDELAFVDLALSDSRIARHLEMLPQPLPAGYETEINLAALDWIDALAPKLASGFVLIADYGWARPEFYAAHRTTGTLRSYAKHRILASPLAQIGKADLTAHVEWTSLAERALANGFALAGFTDQHHFITGLLAGAADKMAAGLTDPKTARALQTLLHPQHLGMKFQFLGLTRNIASAAALSGFRFARNSAVALGLHSVPAAASD